MSFSIEKNIVRLKKSFIIVDNVRGVDGGITELQFIFLPKQYGSNWFRCNIP